MGEQVNNETDYPNMVQDTLQQLQDSGPLSIDDDHLELEETPNDTEIMDKSDHSDHNDSDTECDVNIEEDSMGSIVQNRQCVALCGKILRLMGDEQLCKSCGRHLRSMGDEIYHEQNLKNLLCELAEQDQMVPA